MTIVDGQSLIDALRRHAEAVCARLWLAAHYVGEPRAVARILGTRWLLDRRISVRLLVDSTHLGRIDPSTLALFLERGDVRVLPGLHAKIFICDDACLVTSANLTETAFSRRYEIGSVFESDSARSVVDVFERWWVIGTAWTGLSSEEPAGVVSDMAERLPRLWTLPPDADMER